MLKTSRQEFTFLLPEKTLSILAIHILTNPCPLTQLENQSLTLKDEWLLQVVYVPYQKQESAKFNHVDFSLAWHETINWHQLEATPKAFYRKMPHTIYSIIRQKAPDKSELHINIEAVVEIQDSPP